MLSQHATHFIVYSRGRTGSMLLSRNLGAALATLHRPVPVRHIHSVSQYNEQVNNTLDFDVLQTHITHREHDKKYTRVFSIRRDYVESILSFVLAQWYRAFHVSPTDPEPFYCDTNMIGQLCQTSTQWHRWYASQLASSDLVVMYEKMMEQLSSESDRTMFKNKQNLILNFNEVIDIIQQNKDSITNSLEPFIQHQNPWNIYKFITYSIKF